MRISTTLDALISPTKQRVMTATLLQPGRSWYLHELARHLSVAPSSIQRELALLVRAGILTRRKDGNRAYFQADRGCPVFQDLCQLLLKTVALVDPLREALRCLAKNIEVAFVYGSIAASQERSDSDVDLMVIGSIKLSDLAPLLRKVERDLGRTVNPTVYSAVEFSKKIREGSHFLNTVLQGEILFIHGTEEHLERLAGRPTREATQDQSGRVA
jgi:DNA-binding transcriptional ArsR family regulator